VGLALLGRLVVGAPARRAQWGHPHDLFARAAGCLRLQSRRPRIARKPLAALGLGLTSALRVPSIRLVSMDAEAGWPSAFASVAG
jgi:hypothetical protein